MYEMGPEMDSLTHSLEHLDSQVNKFNQADSMYK